MLLTKHSLFEWANAWNVETKKSLGTTCEYSSAGENWEAAWFPRNIITGENITECIRLKELYWDSWKKKNPSEKETALSQYQFVFGNDHLGFSKALVIWNPQSCLCSCVSLIIFFFFCDSQFLLEFNNYLIFHFKKSF